VLKRIQGCETNKTFKALADAFLELSEIIRFVYFPFFQTIWWAPFFLSDPSCPTSRSPTPSQLLWIRGEDAPRPFFPRVLHHKGTPVPQANGDYRSILDSLPSDPPSSSTLSSPVPSFFSWRILFHFWTCGRTGYISISTETKLTSLNHTPVIGIFFTPSSPPV